MRRVHWSVLIGVLVAAGAIAADFPEAEISNGKVHIKLYLPNAENGSYRGTRFDWSGIINSIKYDGHEYVGQWYPRHDPQIHDAITGPVEEFGADDGGLGYADAKAGGTFVRIGVGVLRKPDEKAYRRFETYEIVDRGKRSIRNGVNWIEFTHEVTAAGGYAYVYQKTVKLEHGSRLTLYHSLRNKGDKPIETRVYDHNFFMIDNATIGPDILIHFPFVPKPDKPLTNGGEIRGQDLVYTRELKRGESVAADMSGFGTSAKDYDFQIVNQKTKASVRITGDRPLTKLYFWSIMTVACPEPYIRITAAPGREMKWRISYDLSTGSVK